MAGVSEAEHRGMDGRTWHVNNLILEGNHHEALLGCVSRGMRGGGREGNFVGPEGESEAGEDGWGEDYGVEGGEDEGTRMAAGREVEGEGLGADIAEEHGGMVIVRAGRVVVEIEVEL